MLNTPSPSSACQAAHRRRRAHPRSSRRRGRSRSSATACASETCGSAASPSSATRARSARAGSRRCSRRPASLTLTLHIGPIPPPLAADRLRRQRARLESTRRLDADRGRLTDPMLAAAAEDADELAGALARGESRLFRSGALPARVRRTAARSSRSAPSASRRCAPRCCCTSSRRRFRAVRRLALNAAARHRPAAAAAHVRHPGARGWFPFASSDPPLEEGVLYGLTDERRARVSSTASRGRTSTRVVLAYSRRGQVLRRRSSKRCGCSTGACRCSSSTPRTSTTASARPSAARTCR